MSLSQLYKALEQIEKHIALNNAKAADIQEYKKLSFEIEEYFALQPYDVRHHIMLIIPVADRPRHLQSCLESIYSLCEFFGYGGKTDYYNKVSVLIAEDSRQSFNRKVNREIARSFTQRGLLTRYFSLEEQKEILSSLSEKDRESIQNIVGNCYQKNFFHKGASITRNITYLKLMQLGKEFNNILFYFIDSDQEFKINTVSDKGEVLYYAINYFQHLDRLFTDNDIEMLTGKVVGDPPVSPSVMAANFLDDVCAFLSKMSSLGMDAACCFHDNHRTLESNDAAYHDMADLFGFKLKASTFEYHCDLKNPHTNADCLERFSSQLNQFFDGVHLTRKTCYQYENISASMVAARTVYTGNFVFTMEALKYFIPFASLKLRMAGPTMGRLLKQLAGSRFVSVNLPMLHERTIESVGRSEFRSDIEHNKDVINLQGEFERQYFGDVMLFSIEKLIQKGYPDKVFAHDDIEKIVLETEIFLRDSYTRKLNHVQKNIKKLQLIFKTGIHCEDKNISQYIEDFICNMNSNFDRHSSSYRLVTTDNSHNTRIADIVTAIAKFKDEITVWSEILSQ